MKIRAILALLLAVAAASAAAAEDDGRFAVFALAAGQTAEVNIVNAAERGAAASPPCRVAVVFADRDGQPIGDPGTGSFALWPGHIASTAIEHPNLKPGERFPVRVELHKYARKTIGRDECELVRASVEVFDRGSGRTTHKFDLRD